MIKYVDLYRKEQKEISGHDPVTYCISRIKSSDSMKEKLKRQGFDVNLETAMTKITDALGVRIVCNYMDDVYAIGNYLQSLKDFMLVRIKDYIANPKPNGYRSYHIILKINDSAMRNIFVEVQIRTMAIDCWASLEHEMKYKHKIKHQKLIESELKRCADEIASTDISMQTIRELINSEE